MSPEQAAPEITQEQARAMRDALVRLDALIDFGAEWNPCGCFPDTDALQDALSDARTALAGVPRT